MRYSNGLLWAGIRSARWIETVLDHDTIVNKSVLSEGKVMNRRIQPLACLILALGATASAQNQRETVVRADKRQLESDASWIYNDFAQGVARAQATGQPLLVLIRCIP